MELRTIVINCVVLVVFVTVTLGGGFSTTFFVTNGFTDSDWYNNLTKPDWNPPPAVFTPMWSTLYILMAVAAFLIWRQGGFKKQALPLTAYFIQLALNFTWVFIFNGAHDLLAALIEIWILWVIIILTAVLFGRVKIIAGLLLIPYILWVAFAGSLNYAFYSLNKDDGAATDTS